MLEKHYGHPEDIFIGDAIRAGVPPLPASALNPPAGPNVVPLTPKRRSAR
jgi:hypothetical protein